MISNDLKEIIILNPVHINWKLKKFEGRETNKSLSDEVDAQLNAQFLAMPTNNEGFDMYNGVNIPVASRFTSPLHRTIVKLYVKTVMQVKGIFQKKKDVTEFFDMVKHDFEELDPTIVDDETFKTNLCRYVETKQMLIVNELTTKHLITRNEVILKENGFNKFISEQNLIKFVTSSVKGLTLKEISSFRFEIPDEVYGKYLAAEELKVFDNYYILYYDPEGAKNPFFIKEQEKDPILFGVMVGSKRLYYIDDWLTDYCTLTYQNIVDKLKIDERL